MESSAVVISPHQAIIAARTRKEVVYQMLKDNILRAGIDYGKVPGSDKPSLLKPGAERLCAAFGFNPRFETLTAIEDWNAAEPLFFYRIMCRLVHIETGLEVATGIGSCNSREAKYRWRWVTEDDLPSGVNKSALKSKASVTREFAFAVERAETSGPYQKSAVYWKQFRDAIASGMARKIQMPTKRGTSDGWEISSVVYRIPNDDIFSLVNTIDKISCKRALVAATLIGANASEFFTQDIEDLAGFGIESEDDVTEGVLVEIPEPVDEKPAVPKGNGTAAPKTEGDWKQNIGKIYNTVLKSIYGNNTHHMRASIEKLEKEGLLRPGMTVEQALVVIKQRKLAKALAIDDEAGFIYHIGDVVTFIPDLVDVEKPDFAYKVMAIHEDGSLDIYHEPATGEPLSFRVHPQDIKPCDDVPF